MTTISVVGPDQYDAPGAGSVASPADEVRRIVDAVAREDGRSPLNEATLLALRHRGLGDRVLWLARSGAGDEPGGGVGPAVGFALAGDGQLSVVVAPDARGHGVGRSLAETALAHDTMADGIVTAWAHGNHPAAARLAERLGFDRVRDLWVMRRHLGPDNPLPPLPPQDPAVVVRPFRPGQDEEGFLAVNAEAFAGHPEQGAMTLEDLQQRMAEPWFDPEGFFVAEPTHAPRGEAPDDTADSPSLLGFHWTKVHEGGVGEVYVVGISPFAQGRGLGKLLTLRGLHHLADRGLDEVILYVEADNDAAIAVYSALGFTHEGADTDVMYARGAARA